MLETRDKKYWGKKISPLEDYYRNDPKNIFIRLLPQNSKNLDPSDLKIILEIISNKPIDYARMFFQVIFSYIKPEKEKPKVDKVDTNSFSSSKSKQKKESIEPKLDLFAETLKEFISQEFTLTNYLDLELKQLNSLESKSTSIKEAEIYFSVLARLKQFVLTNKGLVFEDEIKKFLESTKNGLKDRSTEYNEWKLNWLNFNKEIKNHQKGCDLISNFFKKHLSTASLNELSYAVAVISAQSTRFGNLLFNELVEQLKGNKENKNIFEFLTKKENWKTCVDLLCESSAKDINSGEFLFNYLEVLRSCHEISKYEDVIRYLNSKEKGKIVLQKLCDRMVDFFLENKNNSVIKNLQENIIAEPLFNQCYLEKMINSNTSIKQKVLCLEWFNLEKNTDSLKKFLAESYFDTSILHEKYKSSLKVTRFIESLIEILTQDSSGKNMKYKIDVVTVLNQDEKLREKFKADLLDLIHFYFRKNESRDKQEALRIEQKFNSLVGYLKLPEEIELDNIIDIQKFKNTREELNKSKKIEKESAEKERDELRLRYNALVNGRKISCSDLKDEELLNLWNFGIVEGTKEKINDKNAIKIRIADEIQQLISDLVMSKTNKTVIDLEFILKKGVVSDYRLFYKIDVLKPLENLAKKIVKEKNEIQTKGVIEFILDKINKNEYRKDLNASEEVICRKNAMLQVLKLYYDLYLKQDKPDSIFECMVKNYFYFRLNFRPDQKQYYCYFVKSTEINDEHLENPLTLLNTDGIQARPSFSEKFDEKKTVPVHPVAWALFNGLAEYWKNSKKSSSHYEAVGNFLKDNLKLLSDPIQFIHHFVIAIGNVSRKDKNSKKTEEFNPGGKLLKFLNAAENLLSVAVPVEYTKWKNLVAEEFKSLSSINETFPMLEDITSSEIFFSEIPQKQYNSKTMSIVDIVKELKSLDSDNYNRAPLKDMDLPTSAFMDKINEIKMPKRKSNEIPIDFVSQHMYFQPPPGKNSNNMNLQNSENNVNNPPNNSNNTGFNFNNI